MHSVPYSSGLLFNEPTLRENFVFWLKQTAQQRETRLNILWLYVLANRLWNGIESKRTEATTRVPSTRSVRRAALLCPHRCEIQQLLKGTSASWTSNMVSGSKHAADHNTSVCKLRPLRFGKSIKKGQVTVSTRRDFIADMLWLKFANFTRERWGEERWNVLLSKAKIRN